MALEENEDLYLAHLMAHQSDFATESKIRLAAEVGRRKNPKPIRALHDWSAWSKNRLVNLNPFLPQGQFKKLTIYASVASLYGTTKYLIAYGEWETNYGRMQRFPLRLTGVTDVRIDSDPGFRGGVPWLCLHTANFKYFLLQPAVAQTPLYNEAMVLWESEAGTTLTYQDVDCNQPRPLGWSGLRTWRYWRGWCKDPDGRMVLPGNEGARETDLTDDRDSGDQSDESVHEYQDADEYQAEDGQNVVPQPSGSRSALVRRPKGTNASAKSRGKRKAVSEPRRTRSSRKRNEAVEPATPTTIESDTTAEDRNEEAEGEPCEDDRAGSTSQADPQPSTSDEEHSPVVPPKRARLTIGEMVNEPPSPPPEPAGAGETTVVPTDQSAAQPGWHFQQNAPATHLPGLHALVKPAGSVDAFVPPPATTVTPFNPLPPPVSAARALSDNLADMAQQNRAPGTELRILADLFSQPGSSVLGPIFPGPMRDLTPTASQSTVASVLDHPALDEESEASDGNWFAQRELTPAFNLDLRNLWADEMAAYPNSSPSHVAIPEDMYWDNILGPVLQDDSFPYDVSQ
ncbi:hypothetical protein FRC08_014784 [Ceratobasidium sp. 394]|nr:hypothetical protein FRC08_014784 [Ceratobasidium sp. 394]